MPVSFTINHNAMHDNKKKTIKKRYLLTCIGIAFNASAVQTSADIDGIENIVITGANPLSQLSQTQSIIGQTQTLSRTELHDTPTRSLAEILRNQLVSVNINDVQNNPFQPDVQYRGFTASPLLGLPQGLSIYLNGTRVNEPFGDTVNWDLLPLEALDNVVLFSTSNPIFGQNTLGGALALNTKNGFNYTDTQINASLGQYGREEWSIQTGNQSGNWGWYGLLNQYQEEGWRDYSPSEVLQLFSTLSYHTTTTQVDLSWLHADNELLGNGAIPEDLPAFESRASVYTHPDKTNNELDFVSVNINSELNDSLSIIVNAFYRDNTTSSINGDDSDFGACELDNGFITLCEMDDDDDDDLADINMNDADDDDAQIADADDFEVVEFVGYEDLAFSQISNIDPSDVDGTYNTGQADNQSFGFTTQFTQRHRLGAKPATTIIGFGAINGDIHYAADTTFGILDNDSALSSRTVTPISGIMDAEAMVRLDVDTRATFAYISNITQLSSATNINIAARYNRDHILMNDHLADGEGSLDGDHRFTSFNPAIGLSYQVDADTLFNISLAQATRVPSPAELSCADENDPCRLPNGFVADPPLDKVVTRTLEVSATGKFSMTNYNATVFYSQSIDDIIFQQAGTTSSRGYFINIDKTQRLGAELSAQRQYDNVLVSGSYNYLDATFESSFTSFSPMNPLGPDRQVNPGDSIPGQPKHQVKLRAEYSVSTNWLLGAQYIYASKQYYRGDEANENKPITGYGLINLYSNYEYSNALSFSMRIDNALDHDYDTFGTYGEADEVLEDIYPQIDSPYFIGVGHPRMLSVNAQYTF